MTEQENNLLVVFEERIHDLIAMCNSMKGEIEVLRQSVNEKDEIIRQAKDTIDALQTKYTNLQTARIFAIDDDEFQKARKQVVSLVREVDKSIALLNQ